MKVYIDYNKVKSRMDSIATSLLNSEFDSSDQLFRLKTKHDMLRELISDTYYRVENKKD